MAHPDNIVSTGRGGAGNIGNDSTVYTDGAIVREGPEGQSADNEALSTGRGGAGNIGGAGGQRLGVATAIVRGTSRSRSRNPDGSRRPAPLEDDVVPEPAMRQDDYANFHTGRGGEGNVHKKKYGGHSSAGEQRGDSVGDKIKHALGIGKHHDGSD